MLLIDNVQRGDRLSSQNPPVCCRQSMALVEGVLGPLWECVVCEDGIYVTDSGLVLDVMRSA